MMREAFQIIVAMLIQLFCWSGFLIFFVPYYYPIPDTWYIAIGMFFFSFGWYFLFYAIFTGYWKEKKQKTTPVDLVKAKKLADKIRTLKGTTFYGADGKPIEFHKK